MKYITYVGSAVFTETKRKRKVRLKGIAIEEVKQELLLTGYEEPIILEEDAPEPPTEGQLKYARGVGIEIPDDIDREDLSMLLSRYEWNDKSDPNPGLIEFANNRKFDFSPYIGKKILYNLVFRSLEARDKIAFFTFCVYRYLSDDRHANLDTSIHKETFYSFADSKLDDASFINSMNKYEGESLRYFGKMVIENGDGWKTELQGGSTATIVYRETADFLSDKFGLNKMKTTRLTNDKTITNLPSTTIKKRNETERHVLEENDLPQTDHTSMSKAKWGAVVLGVVFMVLLVRSCM